MPIWCESTRNCPTILASVSGGVIAINILCCCCRTCMCLCLIGCYEGIINDPTTVAWKCVRKDQKKSPTTLGSASGGAIAFNILFSLCLAWRCLHLELIQRNHNRSDDRVWRMREKGPEKVQRLWAAPPAEPLHLIFYFSTAARAGAFVL